MTVIARTRARDMRCLLPAGRDLAGWHRALTAEIAAHLSPAHAALLARPEVNGEEIAWHADAADARPFAELAAADRRALTDALGVILGRIRRLAESKAAPAVAACWPALREIPDLRLVFAADGAPVIAGWGHASAATGDAAGLLARYDDGVPWQPPAPQRAPAWPYLAALAALVLLALLAGIAVPLARARLLGGIAHCTVDAGSETALAGALQEQARSARLRAQLALLQQYRGQQQLLCPPRLAETQPPPTPHPAPAPALPDHQWQQHDLGMLQGCWNRFSDMETRNLTTGQVAKLRSWKICFDAGGHGTQTLVWDDGASCQNPLTARFLPDNTVEFDETRNCTGDRSLVLGRTVCHRVSDTEASCPRLELDGPHAGKSFPGSFRR